MRWSQVIAHDTAACTHTAPAWPPIHAACDQKAGAPAHPSPPRPPAHQVAGLAVCVLDGDGHAPHPQAARARVLCGRHLEARRAGAAARQLVHQRVEQERLALACAAAHGQRRQGPRHALEQLDCLGVGLEGWPGRAQACGVWRVSNGVQPVAPSAPFRPAEPTSHVRDDSLKPMSSSGLPGGSFVGGGVPPPPLRPENHCSAAQVCAEGPGRVG